jgi:hypothetical protein
VADQARLLILDTAETEPAIWELTWGMDMIQGGERKELYPPLPVETVRPALVTLLQEGHVKLFDLAAPDQGDLDFNDALAAIADDRNWIPQAESNQPAAYAI